MTIIISRRRHSTISHRHTTAEILTTSQRSANICCSSALMKILPTNRPHSKTYRRRRPYQYRRAGSQKDRFRGRRTGGCQSARRHFQRKRIGMLRQTTENEMICSKRNLHDTRKGAGLQKARPFSRIGEPRPSQTDGEAKKVS